jgi:hypothetical protein
MADCICTLTLRKSEKELQRPVDHFILFWTGMIAANTTVAGSSTWKWILVELGPGTLAWTRLSIAPNNDGATIKAIL